MEVIQLTRYPNDTYELLKHQNQREISNLWYPINYYHFKDRKLPSDSEKMMFPLNCKKLHEFGEKIEQQRLRTLIEMESPFKVLKGRLENGILPGFGSAHVRETAVTIHQIYGLPYIPSSSVKGVVRRWFIQAYLEGKEENLTNPLPHLQRAAEVGKEIFGTQNKRGIAQFFDIFLYRSCELKPDISTVMYQKYYSGDSKAAMDTMTTVPFANFYKVEVESVDVLFSITDSQMTKDFDRNFLCELLENWTKEALTQLGVGAKTALGFGRFSQLENVTEDRSKHLIEALRKEEQEHQRIQAEQLQQLEAKKLAEKLAQMSSEERLIYEIDQLTTDSDELIEKSKSIIFNEVIDQKNRQAAEKLKAFWLKTGDWKVKKNRKRQYEKVQQLKDLIE